MQGFRLRAGQYQPIRMKDGRLPSQQLGLHLERSGHSLRLWDPTTGEWLPTPEETIEAERERADAERETAQAERERADHLAAEVERLRNLLASQKNGHTTNGAS